MKIAPDGKRSVAVAFLVTLLAVPLFPPLAWATSLATLGLLWFYRDPDRKAPEDDRRWVSPADGKVVEIFEARHPYVGKALKVGIFMSPLDVHVNRAPAAGVVEFLDYVPGRKLMAFNEKASEENERFYVGLRTEEGPLLLVQVAGFLARRIVCRLRRGDPLTGGERYGMIKLGSKVDVYLPASVRPVVVVGQRVRAGETVIGVVEK
ncbi:phosphatidylserine decarboxylase [Aminithiophilus ramosus]|uniref:Phosphatidylserine decarboxylase proenzyme n=2 Tax=Synergistales TaxID=649776 RepID=A0A9Q7EZ72_9BACT|nr:phosphatidylserine decarboxylase [Aminithiophilus ramosus]QTX32756.1 phosphatidylserine decarboxylase [Aminithiophilus ramosus]QVL36633.1 phosphatidylserine decarboxylase [Synergistota bacterium]